MIGNVHSIETFSGVDGPGIRYVLFLQGCNLQCKFCHNADTIPIVNNKRMTVDEVVADYLKYAKFYTRGGGITISGGEPLLQQDFIIALFEELKKHDVHTCIETQGTLFTQSAKFQKLVGLTDLFLVDLKGVNDERALQICGGKVGKTFAFLDYLNETNHPCFISYVLLPGINDDEECVHELSRILCKYQSKNLSFKVLPYHKMGIDKWDKIGVAYQLRDLKEPTNADVEAFVKKIDERVKVCKQN